MESCLLFPLGDIPNHRFSNSQNIAKIIDLKHFEEDGRFFIHTEPGYISFETNAIYNQVNYLNFLLIVFFAYSI